jgi:hypothetical protein
MRHVTLCYTLCAVLGGALLSSACSSKPLLSLLTGHEHGDELNEPSFDEPSLDEPRETTAHIIEAGEAGEEEYEAEAGEMLFEGGEEAEQPSCRAQDLIAKEGHLQRLRSVLAKNPQYIGRGRLINDIQDLERELEACR